MAKWQLSDSKEFIRIGIRFGHLRLEVSEILGVLIELSNTNAKQASDWGGHSGTLNVLSTQKVS